MRRSSFVRSFAFVALAAASIVACGSGTTTTNIVTELVEAGPRASGYTLTFPSTAAAVATESVRVLAFDATDPGSTCSALIQKQKSTIDLPTPLATSTPLSPCDLEKDTSGDAGGALTIPYGNVAVLAIASRGGKDFLLGCTTQTVDGASPPVVVSLSLANSSVSVPLTTCTDLGTHCQGKC